MALIKKMGLRKSEPEPSSDKKGAALPKSRPAVPGTRPVRSGEEGPFLAGIHPEQPEEQDRGPSAEVAETFLPDTPMPRPAEEREPLTPTLGVGSTLQERYQIESILGVGGMSVVYKGRDLRFKNVYRACAIKEMLDRSSPDSHTRAITLKNFEREAGILATLNHAAIPKIYDYFVQGGRIYLVLEFVEGQNLEELLDAQSEPMEEERVVRWAIQICDVLSYLHHHQPDPLVFRDMKPANIMVGADDRVRLIDFGIARVFESDQKGTMIGTEGYSPPEQYRGVAEPRGDIYALGATMHHLLTASDPRLETPFTFHERPPSQLNPEISPQLEAVIIKSLEYDARQRWASAAEMRTALLDLAHLDVAELQGEVAPAAAAVGERDRLVWTFKCEEEIRATPLIYNGLLYIGAYDNNLYALDAENGKFLYKFPTQGGICATASSWERLVVIASEDGAVYALNAQSGQAQWNVRTGGPVRSSPRIFQGTVYVGSDDQNIYAIDLRRGETLWNYRTWGVVRSSATLSDGKVYIGSSDGHLYALDAVNGELQWKYRTGQAVLSSPVTFEGIVYVGSWDSYVYALDQRSGWPSWKYRTGRRVTSSPVVHQGRVYIGSADGNLYCLDGRNGREIFKYEAGSFITSSPVIVGGKIYLGVGKGLVVCLNADSGKEIWSFPTGGQLASSPVVAEGIVYIGSTDNNIYALRA